MNQILKYDIARKALQEANTLEDVKTLSDKTDALQHYAKQIHDTNMEIWLAEIKLRARRKIGEITKEIPTKQGKRADISTSSSDGLSKAQQLLNAGIKKQDASRCEKMAAIPESEFENVIAQAKEDNTPVTYASVEKSVVSNNKNKNVREEIHRQAEEIRSGLIESTEKKYHVISIDPPWPYENGNKNSYDSSGRRAANQYPEMSIEEISNIEIPAQENCIMWLWTTHRFLPDSFNILKNWGFEYKATMVWDKQKIGMGHWLRMQCEFCLLSVKGDPLWENTKVRDIISSPRREHSRKPDEFFNIVNDICIGSKLEYFAREKREGWDVFGNDTSKF